MKELSILIDIEGLLYFIIVERPRLAKFNSYLDIEGFL